MRSAGVLALLGAAFVFGAPVAQGDPGSCGAPIVSGSTATVTCSYTGAAQTWTVPAGVTSATFTLLGGQGGDGLTFAGHDDSGGGSGGEGGSVQATLPVVPGQLFEVLVGGAGAPGDGAAGGAGGFNGGAAAFCGCSIGGGGGGGASDVRSGGFSLAERLLVAGGGGGGGSGGEVPGFSAGAGGASGAAGADATQGYDMTLIGYTGIANGGHGGGAGTATAGGAGGAGGTYGSATGPAGKAGSLGVGGGIPVEDSALGGGAGGGGYFGGGSGGGMTFFAATGGGGGGSDYAAPAATGVTIQDGVRAGDGLVTIAYGVPLATPAVSSIDFGSGQTVGTVSDGDAVTLTNTGASALTVNGESFSGANPGDFLVGATTCSGSLAAGDSCVLDLRFAPQADGSRSATLTVSSDAANGPTAIALTGQGLGAGSTTTTVSQTTTVTQTPTVAQTTTLAGTTTTLAGATTTVQSVTTVAADPAARTLTTATTAASGPATKLVPALLAFWRADAFHGVAGDEVHARYVASVPAVIRIEVRRRGRLFVRRTVHAGRGANTVLVPTRAHGIPLAAGWYVLVLRATAGKQTWRDTGPLILKSRPRHRRP